MRVLITEKIHESGPQLLTLKGFEVICKFGMSVAELTTEIADVDALIVRSRVQVSREIMMLGKELKVIGMHGIGLDHIDLEAARELGITVLNVTDGNLDSTAELAVSLMLSVARKIVPANNDVKNGSWNTNHFIGTQLKGKTLGIIALGKIGARVAKICSAIGMDVVAFDPYCSAEIASDLKVTLINLDDLVAKADVITVHAPLTSQTKYLIADEEIDKMKNGVIIINAARGGILSEAAVYRGLKNGKIGGMGLDVLEEEPVNKNCDLLQFDNVVITPHIGARTNEAQVYVSQAISEKIANFLLETSSLT